MADDDDDEEACTENKFALVVLNFLLNPEIKDDYTLDEFRNYFPTKYRNHDDIKHLHEGFVMKRKVMKETVRRHIQQFYVAHPAVLKKTQQKQQTLKELLVILETKRKQINKDLSKANNELEVLQNNISRCDKAVRDCHLMKKDWESSFDVDIFKKLDNYTKKLCKMGKDKQ